MQKELGTAGAIVGMILVSTLFGGLALAIYPGWPAIGAWLGRIDAPAWVQAVGSILAIFGAAGIAAWQASSSRRQLEVDRRRAETAKALAIDFILRRGKLVVNNANRAVLSRAPATLKLAREQIEMVQAALRALPAFEIPSPRLVFELQRVDRDLLYVLRLLAAVGDSTPAPRRTGQAVFVRVQRRLDQARFAAIEICDPRAIAEAHLTSLGSDDESSDTED